MRRFDLELLNTLATVADAGSLSAAAGQLYRSQSAVSEQIRKLEESCGLTLFVRGKKGASLTPAGARLLVHARKLLDLNDHAYRDMQGLSLAGDLRLAITDYFRPAAIAAVLRQVGDQYPSLRLHVSIRKSASIELEAGSGDFDLGLSMRVLDAGSRRPREKTAGFSSVMLRREPLLWVAAPSFAWPVGQPVPLVALPDTCSLQRYVLSRLDSAGVDYFIAHSASGVAGLQSALSAGLGFSCLNASAVPGDVVALRAGRRLPKLPDAAFDLIVPDSTDGTLVGEVAKCLVTQARLEPR
ncbi:LysR family transcriptional regulator [Burkholderia sp. WAC0059]|uniref:LysR family transcriptional regulator n=1 Tax=Burkholderia sp. WAC0059 TaxID=2066022 RepID=UPI000C7F78CA|nr:LysR family transcriptional regulator [Burkholderia sp. WAC0059]PLZ03146.1 LysR family transcriptional regulator [Burkholderia sp. WAC0059]